MLPGVPPAAATEDIGVAGTGNEGEAASIAAPRAAPAKANRLWAWFTGGNALTRIGVVALFFGVAFLLKYFAEHFTLPIEWRLAAVAAGGFALTELGLRLAAARPAYGLSLQGAGAGVLYLTTYAAFGYYGVLSEAAAIALLVAVTGRCGLPGRAQRLAAARGAGVRGGLPRADTGGDGQRPGSPVRLLRAAQRRDSRARVEKGLAHAQRGRLRVHLRPRACLGVRVLRAGALRDGAMLPRALSRLLRDDRDPVRAARAARGARSRGRAAGVRRPPRRLRAAGGARARFATTAPRGAHSRWRVPTRCSSSACASARTPDSRCCRARSLRSPRSSRR